MILMLLTGCFCLVPATRPQSIQLAVAANFTAAAYEIRALFERDSGYSLALSFGSTGQLYAQIINGAPFAVFLAADSLRPWNLEQEGYGIRDTRFTYARGALALWSPHKTFIDSSLAILRESSWRHCAIANPRTAPYGAAALSVLESLGLLESVRPRLVEGSNIAQAYAQIAGGHAQLGFIAWSQIALLPEHKRGSWRIISQERYAPLVQQAQLLRNGADQPGARSFLAFLQSSAARAVIRSYGYSAGD